MPEKDIKYTVNYKGPWVTTWQMLLLLMFIFSMFVLLWNFDVIDPKTMFR